MRIVLIILMWGAAVTGFSQFSVAAYQMKDYLPQSNYMNPSFIPDAKIVIGLPVMSQIALDASAGFSFNDIFVKGPNDSLILDTENFPAKLNGTLDNTIAMDLQLFLLGIKAGNGYFTFAVRARGENRVTYPSDFIKWAIWGPADNRVNDRIDLGDIKAFGVNYIEYSAGLSKKLSPMITFGARIKYLSGISGFDASQSGTLIMNQDSVRMSMRDVTYNYAGLSQFGINPFGTAPNSSSIDPFSYLNTGNTGFGVDLGIDVRVNDNIDASVALVDMGMINWKTDVNSYTIDNFSYTFKGIDFVELLTNSNANVSDEADSLINLIKPKEQAITSFRTGLNGKFVSSVRYKIGLNGVIGATLYSGLNKGQIDPVFGVNYQYHVKRVFSVLGGVVYRDRKVDNLMAGFVFKPGPLQLYVLSDRINSFFFPNNSHALTLRAGLNFAIGRSSTAVD